MTQWQYYNGANLVSSLSGWQNTPVDAATCSKSVGNGQPNCNITSGTTPLEGTVANRTWSTTDLNGGTWRTGTNSNIDNLIGVNGATAQILPVANQAIAPTASASFNNLGSAVIDGLLIQHMKITTKGL